MVGDGFSEIGRVGLAEDAQLRLWIASVSQGDSDSFAALYQAFAPRLYGYLRLQVNRDGDIEDLMQDTFVTIWRSAARYTGTSLASTWMFGIARHKLLDLMRVRYRNKQLEFTDVAENYDMYPSEEDFADSVATALSIERALASLPPPYAEMFYLVHQESMSYKEIGILLGISEGTVKSRMYHAKLRLRQQLREEGTGDG